MKRATTPTLVKSVRPARTLSNLKPLSNLNHNKLVSSVSPPPPSLLQQPLPPAQSQAVVDATNPSIYNTTTTTTDDKKNPIQPSLNTSTEGLASSNSASSASSSSSPTSSTTNSINNSSQSTSAPGTTGGSASNTNVSVFVRIRPYINENDNEEDGSRHFPFDLDLEHNIVKVQDEQFGIVFDKVFAPEAKTIDIYEQVFRSHVQSACEGYNVTTFAYGQTASGKTHTMMGTPQEPGLIRLAVSHIFDYISQVERKFMLRVAYMEIYNEKVFDLLSMNAQGVVTILQDEANNVAFNNLTEEIVKTEEQVMGLLARGEAFRRFAKTDFNAHSSRSHTIFRMVIESMEASHGESAAAAAAAAGSGTRPASRAAGGGVHRRMGSITAASPSKISGNSLLSEAKSSSAVVKVASLNLVDLAGSETAHSHASSERRMEGKNINLSLLHLKEIIMQLSKGETVKSFRNSKLTRILAPSLRGNAKVAVICNISPALKHLDFSKRTLEFGNCARKIKVKPKVNNICDNALILKYQQEIDELKRQLEQTRAQQQTNANNPEMNREYEEQVTQLQYNLDEYNALILEKSSLQKILKDVESEKVASAERMRKLEDELDQLAERLQQEETDKQRAEQLAREQQARVNKIAEEKSELIKRIEFIRLAKTTAESNARKAEEHLQRLHHERNELLSKLKFEEEARVKAERVLKEKEDELNDLRKTSDVLANKFLSEKKARELAQIEMEKLESEMGEWAATHGVINQMMLEDKRQIDEHLNVIHEMDFKYAQMVDEMFRKDEEIELLRGKLARAEDALASNLAELRSDIEAEVRAQLSQEQTAFFPRAINTGNQQMQQPQHMHLKKENQQLQQQVQQQQQLVQMLEHEYGELVSKHKLLKEAYMKIQEENHLLTKQLEIYQMQLHEFQNSSSAHASSGGGNLNKTMTTTTTTAHGGRSSGGRLKTSSHR